MPEAPDRPRNRRSGPPGGIDPSRTGEPLRDQDVLQPILEGLTVSERVRERLGVHVARRNNVVAKARRDAHVPEHATPSRATAPDDRESHLGWTPGRAGKWLRIGTRENQLKRT